MTSVVLSPAAGRDIDNVVDYLETVAGSGVARAFVTNVERAFRLLEGQPGIGAMRLAGPARRPGLRVWNLRGFDYLICYEVSGEVLTVVRVLHMARDIESLIKE